MRAVDADQICKVCPDWDTVCRDKGVIFCGLWDILKKLPEVDAVQVVRCKDCRFWGKNDVPSSATPDFRVCKRIGGLKVSGGYEYCSRGERKEDSDGTCE